VFASLALVLAIGEAVLRSEPRRNDAVLRGGSLKYRFNPYQRDSLLGYSLRPNWETVHASEDFQVVVRTNELGLRGGPVRSDAGRAPLRLLFAGDSYAFGFGVEENESFASRVGEFLGGAIGSEVEVLNSGVPGWASDQYMLYLRQRGLSLDPDLLIVAIMQNDAADLRWHRLTLDGDGLPMRIESRRHTIDHHGVLRWLEGEAALAEMPIPENRWLAEHSQLYHWIRSRLVRLWLRNVERRAAQPPSSPVAAGAIAGLPPDEIQRGIETSSEFRIRYHEHLVAAIERDAEIRGIPVRFVLIGHAGSDYEAMRAACEARGDACLDTTAGFADSGDAGLRFPNDGHWTAAGHERAARAIASWLIDAVP
jgi:lysophospholipase L1-like esterase